MSEEFLKKVNSVYFIGMGGMGMSALAQWFLSEGKIVSGSDREESAILEKLKKLGAEIFIGHKSSNLKKADLVVYTQAIDEKNPELKKAKKLGIKILSYPQALGLLSQNYKIIAVAGCHGKTTTTAMVGLILEKAGFDPTIIVGSLMKDFGSNFKKGKSEWLVIEACEYRRAFLNLQPKHLIITNIDNDHLDYYKDMNDIVSAFEELIKKVLKGGFIISGSSTSRDLGAFKLKFPGEHYQKNAQLAATLAEKLGIDWKIITNSLESYQGTWRRFDKLYEDGKVTIIDDYAHHPTEIKAMLRAVHEAYSDKKIICIFQPHLFSRTKILLFEFAKSFDLADQVIVTDIYAAREKNIWGINANDLVLEIQKNHPTCLYISEFNKILDFIKQNLEENTLVLTLGAGNINQIAKKTSYFCKNSIELQ